MNDTLRPQRPSNPGDRPSRDHQISRILRLGSPSCTCCETRRISETLWDYKVTVNKIAKIDKYPLPHIDDILSSLSGGKTFSKLDLAHAYQKVLLDENSQQSTYQKDSTSIPDYHLECPLSPAIFQRVMEMLLQGITNVSVKLDNILVIGKTESEHLQNLQKVLTRLKHAGMRLNDLNVPSCYPTSNIWDIKSLLRASSQQKTRWQVTAILEAPPPQNVTQLCSFLGMLNYCAKFLPRLSTLLALLYRKRQGGLGEQQIKVWGSQAKSDLFQDPNTLWSRTRTYSLLWCLTVWPGSCAVTPDGWRKWEIDRICKPITRSCSKTICSTGQGSLGHSVWCKEVSSIPTRKDPLRPQQHLLS